MRTREPRASAEKFATRVAGGQTTRSIWRESLTASWVMRSSSLLDLRRPFIFQLPTTSGRRSTLAIACSLVRRSGTRAVGYGKEAVPRPVTPHHMLRPTAASVAAKLPDPYYAVVLRTF